MNQYHWYLANEDQDIDRELLVAAAPDLFGLCQKVVSLHAGEPADRESIVGQARELVARVQGEQK